MYNSKSSVSETISLMSTRSMALRKKQGITQEQLATAAQVSLSSVKRYEQSGTISLGSLLKVAAVLGRLEDFNKLFQLDSLDKKIEKKFDI